MADTAYSEMTIKTNNIPRELLSWHELTAKEKEELDYVDPEFRGLDFFRYKGNIYDTEEFMATRGLPENSPLRQWHGYKSDSYFSGVLIRHPFDPTCGRDGSYDYDHIIVATFYQ